MKLQDQVCTLEQAMRLKGFGVKQDSIFSWYYCTDRDDEPALNKSSKYNCPTCGYPSTPYYAESSAFTVAELGAMLPRYYPSWRCLEEGGQKEFWIATIIGQPEGFERDKEDVMDIRTVCAFDRYGATQAEALAALLISLLETGAVTIDEINTRLCPET